MMRTTLATILGLVAFTSLASAEPSPNEGKMVFYGEGRYALHLMPASRITPVDPALPPSAADTHILFMNKCTGGCTVHYDMNQNPDNRTDATDIGKQGVTSATYTLSQFSQSDAAWGQVMTCMRGMFSRFNVTVTDVDPGQTPHMEVMVAGLASQMGLPLGVGGVADFPCSSIGQCQSFISNALVFDYANESFYAGQPLSICATAAQEIAHTWALDHVVDATDPMTYNSYNGMRQYKDNQKCGSDCQGGQGPIQGETCTGSGGQATHVCAGTGGATQNEVSTITALFGSNMPDTTPPTVSITAPANNASVMPGFSITATGADDQGLAGLEAKLDGTSLGMDSTAPFQWVAPATLATGSHHVVVTATDLAGNTAMAAIDVIYGAGCTQNSDCASTQVCDHGVCVAGPGAAGGLGSPCASNTDCASGSCGSDGAGNMYCVSSCDVSASTCPSGFQCLATGGGAGVCWPGETGGHGGCNTSGNSGASLLLLGLGALLVSRRKRT